jgi:hypothetical protein
LTLATASTRKVFSDLVGKHEEVQGEVVARVLTILEAATARRRR